MRPVVGPHTTLDESRLEMRLQERTTTATAWSKCRRKLQALMNLKMDDRYESAGYDNWHG